MLLRQKFRSRHGASLIKVALVLAVLGTLLGLAWSLVPVAQPPQLPAYRPAPVPVNRQNVTPGFQGAVHPLLRVQTRLQVAVDWTTVGLGRDRLDRNVPRDVYRLFTDLKAAAPSHIYTERDFSGLLPQATPTLGQIWEIDPDVAARFLRQFHPHPTLQLVALGRRAGPDGAFAILRAVSPTHLDILLRIHAEFELAPNVWYTPACFWGQLRVNSEAGVVESFRLWLPTEQPLNVHLTVAESIAPGEIRPQVFRKIERGDVVYARRDIVRVERMELTSRRDGGPPDGPWSDALDLELAQRKLKSVFYAFADVDWVPWREAVSRAQSKQRPIVAVVLWGALDDQSC